jgi:hypothetical protein
MVVLGGCGGNSPAGPKQPGVEQVILVASDATVFTGQVIPSAQIVSLVIDSTGSAISDATISLSAPAGWTVHHDTLIAPTTEGTATVTVSASRGNSHAQSSMQISAVTNLKAHGPWTLEFGCQPKDTSYHVDSFTVVARVDSLVHTAPVIAQSQTTIWQMWYAQDSVTVYGHTGTTFVTSFSQENVGIAPVPDTLHFGLPYDLYNPNASWATRPNKSVWRYLMPSSGWCAVTAYDASGYVTTGRTAIFSSP